MRKFVVFILALTVFACGKDTSREDIRKQLAQ